MISCLSQSRLSVSHTTSSGPSLVFNPTFFIFLGADAFFSPLFHIFVKTTAETKNSHSSFPLSQNRTSISGHSVPFNSILSHFFQISVPLSQIFSCYISEIAVCHIIRISIDLCCLRLGDKCKDRNIFDICKRKMKGDLSFFLVERRAWYAFASLSGLIYTYL